MPTIILKRNDISGNVPTTAELELGELAINTVDGQLYTKIFTNGQEIISEIGTGEKSQLKKITEGGNTGWALLGDDRSFKGDIGTHSLDFSVSDTADNFGAVGNWATSFGYCVVAEGDYSFAEGYKTQASGYASYAEGGNTKATGNYSHAEGYYTIAGGTYSHAEGLNVTAADYASHAEGSNTIASGEASHAEGYNTIAPNNYMHVAGKFNSATSVETIHETGIGTDEHSRKNAFEIYTDGRLVAPELTTTLINTNRSLVTKEYVDAHGGGGSSELEKITENSQTGWALLGDNRQNKIYIGYHAIDFSQGVADSPSSGRIYGAGGAYSFAEGKDTLAGGDSSHAEGYHCTANGYASHAEGYYATTTSGQGAHAEGYRTNASAWASHAEGYFSQASGYFSHAEGNGCLASGQASHAEGFSEASGDVSHSEGKSTAIGDASHSEGYETSANGEYSHSEGFGTVAQNTAMHAAGRFNVGTATDTIHETGIGANDSNRKNAFEIYTDGRLVAPELTTTLINANRSLVTKEYVDANGGGGSSELEKITEGGNTGWTLLGDDRDTKGDIGEHSIDFSQSPNNSTTQGPTGDYSMAVGQNIVVGGNHSFAAGYELEATGVNSVSFGDHCRSTGRHAFSGGLACHAEGFSSFAFGQDSTASGSSSCAFGRRVSASNDYMIAVGMYNTGTSTDTVCEVGIGLNNIHTANAFEIYNDGTVTAPEATVSLIDSRGNKTLINKEYLQSYLLSADFGNSFPTTDPGVSGRVWNDGGTLKVST